MQVHSQVLHDLQLQISSYLPTAMLQNDLRAHYTNKDKSWFLITQHAKADRIRQLQFSLQFPQLHSRASRQPHTPCCQSHPLFDVPDPQLLKAPFTLLTGCCAVLYSLHSIHLMLMSIYVQWSTPGSHSRIPNHIAPIQKGRHSGTSTMRWRQQDSSPGDQFYCLPGTNQKACCPLFQSRQGSCFVYCDFSCKWQVGLSLSQVQERNTEKLLYLVSRPSLSGAGDKNRTLKRCSIKPWSSKHLPSKSTSVAQLYQLEEKK